jgi:hypothetical protein
MAQEMNVAMSLTLSDLASAPLKEFRTQLATLGDVAKRISSNLRGVSESLDKVTRSSTTGGDALGRLSAQVELLGRAISGAAPNMASLERTTLRFAEATRASLAPARSLNERLLTLSGRARTTAKEVDTAAVAAERLGAGTSSLSEGVARLEMALAPLGEALLALKDELVAGRLAFRGFGAAAGEASTQVETAGAKMEGAGAQTKALTGEVDSLATALRGMAEIWAGAKIEHGLKASVESAKTMAELQAKMRAQGFSQDQVKYATQQSWKNSQANGYASAADFMEARQAVILATKTDNEKLINAVVPHLVNNALIYRGQVNPEATIAQAVGNMLGLAETRGQTNSPEALLQTSDAALQVALTTRMKLQAQEGVMRQARNAGSLMISTGNYQDLMALAETLMTSGHEAGGGGGRGVTMFGTADSALMKVMLGGKMSKQTFEGFKAMGMWTPGTTARDTSTTQTDTKGALLGALQGQTHMIDWVRNVLGPRVLAYVRAHPEKYFKGANVNDPAAQLKAITARNIELFGGTGGQAVTQLATLVMDNQVWARITQARQMMAHAATGAV